MLLGLLAAVMLATLLQLNALRSRRAEAFAFAADGTIDLRCWTVVEASATVGCSAFETLRAAPVLMLPPPARRAQPLRFVGTARMLAHRLERPRHVRPPDAIIIPDDVLQAIAAAGQINARIWQSPPGRPAAFAPRRPMAVSLH